MTNPRIVPLEAPYTDEVASMLEKWMPPNSGLEPLALFRVLTQHFDLTSRARPLASGILGHGTLTPNHREIVILRTCARCGAEYEWGVHVAAFSQSVGLTDAQVAATLQAVSGFAGWSEEQVALIEMVDALHDEANVNDGLWEKLESHWTTEQILEILITVGWYHAISYVANVSRIPLEQWAARFPA